MVERFFILVVTVMLFLVGCEKELLELSMSRNPYDGNNLRTDGYYYSNHSDANDVGVAVFYNGVCIHNFTHILHLDTLRYIENEILLNNDLMSQLRNTPTHIGVFQIDSRNIKFETWSAERRYISTYSHYGEILNDTTFLITKYVNNKLGKSFSQNLTYKFKKFSPKPDSTNRFIK